MRREPSSKEIEKIADGLFDSSITPRERAIFEGAITLGALYHQFVGLPIIRDRRILRLIERTIEQTMRLQPYKERITVRIREAAVKGRRANPFDYSELEGRMLEAKVVSTYRGHRATLAMKYLRTLKYNLMYVEKMELPTSGEGKKSSK